MGMSMPPNAAYTVPTSNESKCSMLQVSSCLLVTMLVCAYFAVPGCCFCHIVQCVTMSFSFLCVLNLSPFLKANFPVCPCMSVFPSHTEKPIKCPYMYTNKWKVCQGKPILIQQAPGAWWAALIKPGNRRSAGKWHALPFWFSPGSTVVVFRHFISSWTCVSMVSFETVNICSAANHCLYTGLNQH